MRKTIFAILFIVTPLLLRASLPALAATEPLKECNLPQSLEALAEIKDQKEEWSAYQVLLQEILSCSLLETQNLKGRLLALSELEEQDAKLRDEFLSQLDTFDLYYRTIEEQLSSKERDITALKQIAAELLLWRKEHYSTSAKEIASFIFIFQGKDAIRTANIRLRKISLALLDAGLLFRRDTWKDFRILLNEAQQHIDKASKLNTEAYDLFSEEREMAQATSTASVTPIDDSTEAPPSVTGLLRQSLTEIKEGYRLFGEIGKIVKKILG